MNRVEAKSYRKTLHTIIRGIDSPRGRMGFLVSERSTPEYRAAHASKPVYLRPERNIRETPVEKLEPAPVEEAKPEVQRTKVQEDILWARKALYEWEDFLTTPTTGVKTRTQRVERERKVTSISKGLLEDTDRITTAFSVWGAREEEGGGLLRAEASRSVLQELQRTWKDISSQQLAKFVSLYAKDEDMNSFFGEALRWYFKSPTTQKERVDALYTYTNGILDLADDLHAFKVASRIGRYATPILPAESVFHRDIYLAGLFAFEDPELRTKGRVVTQVLSSDTVFSEAENDEIQRRNTEAIKGMYTDNRHLSAIKSAQIRSGKAIGYDRVEKLVESINEMYDRGISLDKLYKRDYEGLIDASEIDEIMRIAEPLMPDENMFADPLWQKFQRTVEPKFLPHIHKKVIIEQSGGESYVYARIKIPGKPYIMELAIPGSMGGRQNEVMRFLRESEGAEDVDIYFAEPPDGIGPKSFRSWKNFEGHKVHALYREPVESEKNLHDLELLNAIGFPEVGVEDIAGVNNTFAQSIIKRQTRFLNERGISVPLTHPVLRALGYKRMEFKKDTDDPEKTKVKVIVSDAHQSEVAVEVKLDTYLDFDLEGKSCDLSLIGDSLRNVMLTFLYPVLCEPSIRDSEGQRVDMERLFVDRVCYLGFLREGYKFRQPQADALLEDQGKDLAAVSEQRKKEFNDTRNSTYYRPKISEGADRPPVVINIPLPVDKFTQNASV